ncbi:hypothetical protein LGM85_01190 [Burkholderia multivorans]|uniref:hypothetical protein n=1 Tax=Burkholderia multivorans TaxID=87883 RepID=UPI001C235D43|nr:hypothetical protein [Burkholderia multivorans]MBU9260277.1 hypothetical protein [Burkholderia multivorans]MBU9297980.1 hypothetical protein [Burkholderia multivorans]MBU9612916.1 hypothetical protein [Burkholderia multivorans]MCA8482539.1 hypothetical protein [Burkholderia multivorans]MDN7445738.1 hypothetical protein [Burkholderia multivorans]
MKGSGVRRARGVIFVACLSALVAQSASADSRPGVHQIKNGPWLGCDTEDRFGKIMSYSISGDTAAFKKAAVAAINAGSCTLFRTGQTVYLSDVKILGGTVKVRRDGETEEYWTAREAVK